MLSGPAAFLLLCQLLSCCNAERLIKHQCNSHLVWLVVQADGHQWWGMQEVSDPCPLENDIKMIGILVRFTTSHRAAYWGRGLAESSNMLLVTVAVVTKTTYIYYLKELNNTTWDVYRAKKHCLIQWCSNCYVHRRREGKCEWTHINNQPWSIKQQPNGFTQS